MPISRETLDFLAENRMRNDKAWFRENKERYETLVKQPMLEIAEKLVPVIEEIDPLMVTRPQSAVSRIYRDTRYSRDKTIFRDVMWVSFQRDKKVYDCPAGFVLEFSPNGFRYGCGYYKTPRPTMQAIRELVLKNDKSFREAEKAYRNQHTFQLEGECYKRAHYPEHPKQEWLEKRTINFLHNSEDFELLYSKDLPLMLSRDFLILKPMYRFLMRAEVLARLED